ncbi:MAG: GNAT family N-acetyltransferase, partial [Proteobacteria bacterium]|nr:GNAT family N-acetyltransferase [Pseudomonadota bacterium]
MALAELRHTTSIHPLLITPRGQLKDQAIDIPTLTTTRLALAPLTMAHSAGMYQLWSNPAVSRYSGEARDAEGNLIPMPATSPHQTDLIIDFWLIRQAQGSGFRWSIFEQAQFIGTVGFNRLGPTAEIAWHLLPARWGRGYMYEACSAAINWHRKQSGARKLEAYIEPRNEPSVALAKRLGFTPTNSLFEGA